MGDIQNPWEWGRNLYMGTKHFMGRLNNSLETMERSYIITYLVYLLIYIFVKDMSQSNSRKNKKELIRVYKIKQRYITKTKFP